MGDRPDGFEKESLKKVAQLTKQLAKSTDPLERQRLDDSITLLKLKMHVVPTSLLADEVEAKESPAIIAIETSLANAENDFSYNARKLDMLERTNPARPHLLAELRRQQADVAFWRDRLQTLKTLKRSA